MKFRYKVLFTNLILLSLGLGLVGYLMIHKNFELAKQTQLKNAIVQNNLVQSSVEYELLQLLNSVSDNSETSNNNTDNNNAEKSSISASSIAAQAAVCAQGIHFSTYILMVKKYIQMTKVMQG